MPLPDSVQGFAAELLAVSDRFDATRVMELVNGWASLRERMLPVTDPVEHLAVSYLDRRALASERAQNDESFVDALLASASESARLSGSVPAIQRVEVESLHRQALGGDESAWPRAHKLADELEAGGELTEAAGALMTLSRNPDPVRGMHDALRAAELFDRAGQPRWAVTALQAAGYAGGLGRPRRVGVAAAAGLRRCRGARSPRGHRRDHRDPGQARLADRRRRRRGAGLP